MNRISKILQAIIRPAALLGLTLAGWPVLVAQQDINKEIVVVKPYQPSLSDAFKINVLPKVSDSIEISPDFTYAIQPRKYEAEFEIEPIRPANIVGQPLTKLYKSYLKLGFGNYVSPVAELSVASLRSRDHSAGVWLRHHSINGKLKLDKDTRIKPGYNDNAFRVYGKKIFRNSSLSGDLHAGYLGVNFYGIPDTVTELPDYADLEQHYIRTGAEARFKATHDDTTDLIYDTRIAYDYFQDGFDNHQHKVAWSGDFAKYIGDQTAGLNAGYNQYIAAVGTDSTSNTGILRLSPWISRKTGEYFYQVGVGLIPEVADGQLNMHIYPRARLKINIVDRILSASVGINGFLQENDMGRLAKENPYVQPGLQLRSTSHKFIVTGGLQGSLSSSVSWNASLDYSLTEDMPFFVNDTVSPLGNQFTAVYDDYEGFRLYAELTWQTSEKLWFHARQTFHKYNLDNEEHPWNLPLYELDFSVRYNLRDKILASMDLFYTGMRYAKNLAAPADPWAIDANLDFNVGLEYRYTDLLSAFLRLNHILGSENFIYYRYPTMRFNLVAGFTYSL